MLTIVNELQLIYSFMAKPLSSEVKRSIKDFKWPTLDEVKPDTYVIKYYRDEIQFTCETNDIDKFLQIVHELLSRNINPTVYYRSGITTGSAVASSSTSKLPLL